jgi:Flp pilus assembly protein TadG
VEREAASFELRERSGKIGARSWKLSWELEAMRVRKSLRDDRGDALVEFAIASVLFFITIFGVIGFGLGVWRYNLVANLAQEGARWASVRGSSSSSPASAGDIQTFVTSRAIGMAVTVPTPPTSNPSTLDAGDIVTVQVQTQFTPFTTIVPHTTLTLSSTAKMVMAR